MKHPDQSAVATEPSPWSTIVTAHLGRAPLDEIEIAIVLEMFEGLSPARALELAEVAFSFAPAIGETR